MNVDNNSIRPLVQLPVVGQGLMLSAFDYALGRKTYMPSIVSRVLSTAGQWLTIEQSQYVKLVIRNTVASGEAGAGCDVDRWLDLLEALDKHEARVELDYTFECRWQKNDDGAYLFPGFKSMDALEDWWCLVGCALRYDLRGDGRLALADYKTLISLNKPILSERWRMNLMRDVEDKMCELEANEEYSDHTGKIEIADCYLWLMDVRINGKIADRQYLKNECIDKAVELTCGGCR